MYLKLCFENLNLVDGIPLAYSIQCFQSFNHFSENCMISVKVCCVFTTVANEKLRSSCISTGVCHRKNASVVKLIVSVQFTVNTVSGTTCTSSVRTPSLNNKIRNNAVPV